MVYHKEYDGFLHTLRNLGVVHVKETKSIANYPEIQELTTERKRINTTLQYFKKLNNENKDTVLLPAKDLSKTEGLRWVEKVEALQEKKAQLLAEKQVLLKDIAYMESWGDFSYATLSSLKEAGYIVTFFNCPTSRFAPEWVDKYNAIVINDAQSVSNFITITKEGEPIDIEAERPKMPDRGLEVLRTAYQQLQDNLEQTDNKLKQIAASEYNTLEALDKNLQDEFNYANVQIQTERQADNRLMFLEGWTTKDQAKNLETELDKQSYFFQQLEIQQEDRVPIKLKNNAYSRLFEPLTRLFSLPNYAELDPTPMLAPFFMLFFGLCFGDGGYGLLVLLACTFLKKKFSPDMRPFLSLAQYLGGAAILVGILTGTFFGVALVDVPALKAIKDYFLTTNNLMTLSLVLGLVHIVFSKCVAAYKTKVQKGIKHSLAPWAWVFVIVSLLLVFGLPMMDIQLPQTLIYVCYGIAGAAGLVVLLYNSPGKSIFLNVGSALWATYNVASGMLGDTLSYLRLFAIGLAGGILGGVFNMLAIETTSGLPLVVRIPLMLFVLLVGHGMNIALCAISSVVHPIRLIFVEYFKNSEYEGGGIAYLPFKKTS
ncbi:MAG: ATPase [Tannerellaceae bacterium]|nr:ATPase [Tannerellaceae bacterium]